jgi:hypothetical protein
MKPLVRKMLFNGNQANARAVCCFSSNINKKRNTLCKIKKADRQFSGQLF